MNPLVIVWIIVAIFVVIYSIKDKITVWLSNPEYERKYSLAIEKINASYIDILALYVQDETIFRIFQEIIWDENIEGILRCKEQNDTKIIGDTKTFVSGAKRLKIGMEYFLVIGENTIYNIQLDAESNTWSIIKIFPKTKIKNIIIRPWTKELLYWEITQTQKITLLLKDKPVNVQEAVAENNENKNKEKFICYDVISKGKINKEKTMVLWASLDKQTETDVLEWILTYTIPQKTFEKLAQEYNETIG